MNLKLPMVSSHFIELELEKEKQALSKRLHLVVAHYFFQRKTCDINDSMASILGICDMEASHTVPKIKKYIQRVNEALDLLSHYQTVCRQEEPFNVSLIVRNVLEVVRDHCLEQGAVKIRTDIADINGLGGASMSHLEELILYCFVQMVAKKEDGEINVKLYQKNHNAILNIKKDNFHFTGLALEEIEEKHNDLRGKVEIMPYNTGTEITIHIPLHFEKKVMKAVQWRIESVSREKAKT